LGLHMSDDDENDSLSIIDLNCKKTSPKVTKSPKKSSFFSDIVEPKRKKRVKTLDSDDEADNTNNSNENDENIPAMLNDDSSNDRSSAGGKPKRIRMAINSDSE
jgi:hypothetical protein